jgi:hypothetical protein
MVPARGSQAQVPIRPALRATRSRFSLLRKASSASFWRVTSKVRLMAASTSPWSSRNGTNCEESDRP